MRKRFTGVPIEYSPSSTTVCKGCGSRIYKGELRVALQYRRPWYFHFDCYQPKNPRIELFASLKDLKEADVKHVMDRIKQLQDEKQRENQSLLETAKRLEKPTKPVKELFVNNLPLEMWHHVTEYIGDVESLNSLGATCRELYDFVCSHPIWEQVVKARYPYMIEVINETFKKLNVSWRSFYFKIRHFNCIHCGSLQKRSKNFHQLLGAILCKKCVKYYKTINKTECKKKYGLNDTDLDQVAFRKYWGVSCICHAYLEVQIAYIAEQKKKRIEELRKKKIEQEIKDRNNRRQELLKALNERGCLNAEDIVAEMHCVEQKDNWLWKYLNGRSKRKADVIVDMWIEAGAPCFKGAQFKKRQLEEKPKDNKKKRKL